FNFRDQAPVHGAVCDRLGGLGHGEKRQPGGRIVDVPKHAGRRGDKEQVVGRERAGELVADDVRVDVVDVAGGVAAEAGDDGDVAVLPGEAEELDVEADDVADMPEIDGIRAAAGDDARRPHGRLGGAVETERVDAGARQRRAEVDVDLAGDDHLHDVQRRGVGDAPAPDLAGLEAEAGRERGGLRPPAVHDRDLGAALRQI